MLVVLRPPRRGRLDAQLRSCAAAHHAVTATVAPPRHGHRGAPQHGVGSATATASSGCRHTRHARTQLEAAAREAPLALGGRLGAPYEQHLRQIRLRHGLPEHHTPDAHARLLGVRSAAAAGLLLLLLLLLLPLLLLLLCGLLLLAGGGAHGACLLLGWQRRGDTSRYARRARDGPGRVLVRQAL
jgi:hypothetical protein